MPSNHCLLSNKGTARSLMKKPCFWLNLTCFAHGWMSQQLKESNKNSSAYFKAKKQLYKFLCQIFWVDLLIVRNNCMFPNKNANGWGNVGAFNWYLLCVKRVDFPLNVLAESWRNRASCMVSTTPSPV